MVDKNRLFVGLILIFLITFFFYLKLDYIFLGIIFLFLFYELAYCKIINLSSLFITVTVFFILYFLLNFLNLSSSIYIFFYLVSLISSLIFVNLRNHFFSFYILTCLIFIYLLIDLNRNIFYFAILISFLNDTSAYVFGKYFKGPLIAPKISPNKTWSGTIISILVTTLFMLYFNYSIIFSFVVAISLYFGDLYFSFIKRRYFIKDFSNLLFSHGGLLDRFDSIFPVIFLFYINQIGFI